MFKGQSNVFKSNDFDMGEMVKGNDLFGSLFIYNMDNHRQEISSEFRLSIDKRADLFAQRVSEVDYESTIAICNRIFHWDTSEKELLVPTQNQLRGFNIDNL